MRTYLNLFNQYEAKHIALTVATHYHVGLLVEPAAGSSVPGGCSLQPIRDVDGKSVCEITILTTTLALGLTCANWAQTAEGVDDARSGYGSTTPLVSLTENVLHCAASEYEHNTCGCSADGISTSYDLTIAEIEVMGKWGNPHPIPNGTCFPSLTKVRVVQYKLEVTRTARSWPWGRT